MAVISTIRTASFVRHFASTRRPAERRDPYAVPSRLGAVAETFRNHTQSWLWVPAFAGTTHGGSLSRRLRRQRERTAEHHVLANARDRRALADQFEIPERVADVADQHRAGKPALRYHQLLVGAAPRIAKHEGLAT